MKQFRIILYMVIVCYGCGDGNSRNSEEINITATNTSAERSIENANGAYFQLTHNRFDFGEIKRKKVQDIHIDVPFVNVGDAPLLILKADVSCGCISVDYPKNPILPNQEEIISVHIDTRNQEGVFNKTVFFKTNAENDVELIRILGSVKN